MGNVGQDCGNSGTIPVYNDSARGEVPHLAMNGGKLPSIRPFQELVAGAPRRKRAREIDHRGTAEPGSRWFNPRGCAKRLLIRLQRVKAENGTLTSRVWENCIPNTDDFWYDRPQWNGYSLIFFAKERSMGKGNNSQKNDKKNKKPKTDKKAKPAAKK